MTTSININSIGFITEKNSTKQIEIERRYRTALEGLQNFSHAIVIWWGHLKKRELLTLKKPYKNGPQNIGIFATRAETRPNPVLTTIIEITSLETKTGIIKFPYIDAEALSPVLDLKPYLPCSDKVTNSTTAHWSKNWPKNYEASATFNWSEEFNF